MPEGGGFVKNFELCKQKAVLYHECGCQTKCITVSQNQRSELSNPRVKKRLGMQGRKIFHMGSEKGNIKKRINHSQHSYANRRGERRGS